MDPPVQELIGWGRVTVMTRRRVRCGLPRARKSRGRPSGAHTGGELPVWGYLRPARCLSPAPVPGSRPVAAWRPCCAAWPAATRRRSRRCAQAGATVFGVVRSVVRDSSQAEEVSQEVLLEVWRCAPRFQPGRGSAMAWVTTIAHRRAVDRVRSERRSAERQQRAASHQVAYDEVAERVEARLDQERVRHCLGSLTKLQRESVTLAYYGGYTFREIAGLLGVAEGTVKTRMRDGLIRLRDCLGAGR